MHDSGGAEGAADDLCFEEGESHGDLGPVADSEPLARVVQKKHIKEGNKVSPGAFRGKELVDGVSMLRTSRMTREDLEKQTEVVIKSSGGELGGVMVCEAAVKLRALPDLNDKRLFCVIDDPIKNDPKLPDSPAHAIARLADPKNGGDETEVKRIKALLLGVLGKPLNLTDVSTA